MIRFMACLVLAFAALAVDALAEATETSSRPNDLILLEKVTQGHITWHFDKAAPVGQFVNGDYYVVGPVTITRIEPPPADGRNGSVLNLKAPSDKDRDRSASSFDNRIRNYDASRTSTTPFEMKAGDMLVSSVSTEKGKHMCLFNREKNLSPVLSYSILTCLEASVPPDTFRPGYCDRGMKLYRARDIQWWQLHSLEHVEEVPDIDRWAGLFRQPWIDLVGFCFAGAAEYQPQYARETVRAESFATLLLNLDFPHEKKRPLLINFVQYGIDLWSIVKSEPEFRGWKANGGHGNGRKWAICFAGMMLGDKEMASPSVSQPDFRFGMDMQTAYGKSWTGAKVVYAGHWGLYKGEPAGKQPQHKPYEHLEPKDWPIGEYKYPWMKEARKQYAGEAYRRSINSPVWVGTALAARIMHAEPFYAHNAFFDYVDRWMTEDDAPLRAKIMEQTNPAARHDFREDKFHAGRISDPFVELMWKKYRNAIPPKREPPAKVDAVP